MNNPFPIIPTTTSLFRGISAADCLALMKQLGATTRHIAKGGVVLREGQLKRNIGVLLDGELEMFETDENGRRAMVGYVEPSETFATVFAFAEVERHPATIVATCESEILVIPISRILPRPTEAISRVHCQFVRNLLAGICETAWSLRSRAFILSQRSTAERLITYLREQKHANGSSTFAIPFDRQELADFLCVDRCALSTVLGNLRRKGVLSFRKNVFTLKD